ncbi:ABC transporter ATP-binding protein [Streptomyces sp. CA2R106]|uniref:ABC transporter ATP-binding protein n=1 Tax=Streptomyces sp. CA2R106 TaxID=3120153 RepID=UPI00300A6A13
MTPAAATPAGTPADADAAATPAPRGPVLAVEGLDVHYGHRRRRRRALSGVSLSVAAGETVGVIGETGSGKSTLARAVLGLVRTSAGSITVGGEDVTGYGAAKWRALRRRGVVQYVFQDPLRSLDPDLTVADSLTEPLLLRGVPRAEAATRARAFLTRVRLDEELLDRLPGELSGGQRQRVAVARALVTGPELVILDEPVSALDSANRVQVLEILKELRATGVAIVLISHDLGSVAGIADRIAVLYRGELVEDGPAREVIDTPQHPYTRLLVSSAPTLHTAPADRAERDALRALLNA